MDSDVRIIGTRVICRNWGELTETELELRRRDGTWQRLRREVYDHGNAAAILLCDPDRGNVVLTRQFRLPAYQQDGEGQLIEACAGLLAGLEPEACAIKEAEEETGYRVRDVRHAFDAYLSPGSLSEKVSCFTGRYDPSSRVSQGGGLAHEGEDIEVLEMAFETAMAMIGDGRIADAKTIMLLQYAALAGIFPGSAARISPGTDPR